MTWVEFLKWSALLYCLYYGVNILLDANRELKFDTHSGLEEALHFTEYETPTTVDERQPIAQVEMKPAQVQNNAAISMVSTAPSKGISTLTQQNAIEGSGVDIKTLFELAQKEAIEFTNKVSFA
jgi:hypothetical protein